MIHVLIMVKIILCNYTMLFFSPGCSVDIKYIIIFFIQTVLGDSWEACCWGYQLYIILVPKTHIFVQMPNFLHSLREGHKTGSELWGLRSHSNVHCSRSWAPGILRLTRIWPDRSTQALYSAVWSACVRGLKASVQDFSLPFLILWPIMAHTTKI